MRNSNIELLRIVAMLFIVAHHMVHNSGLSECFDYAQPTVGLIWLQWLGGWGKTAINAFVVITGYFMCESALSMRRLSKLIVPVVFWQIAIYLAFLAFGREVVSFKRLFELVGYYFRGINNGFTVSFIWFYLGIPFYNIIVKNSTRNQLYALIGLLLLHFTFSATCFASKYSFNHSFWYMTVYFIGAAIRKYPLAWMADNKKCIAWLFACIGLASLWMWGNDILMWNGVGKNFQYWLISDSDKPLALAIGVLAFLVFRNLNIGYIKVLNAIASTTFGVLLIHANSDAMRQWLWHDLLNVPGWYSMKHIMLICISITAATGVFVACSALEYLRVNVFNMLCRVTMSKKGGRNV